MCVWRFNIGTRQYLYMYNVIHLQIFIVSYRSLKRKSNYFKIYLHLKIFISYLPLYSKT